MGFLLFLGLFLIKILFFGLNFLKFMIFICSVNLILLLFYLRFILLIF